MRQLLSIVLLVSACGFAAVDQPTGESLGLHIKTVDENHKALNVQTLTWWEVGNLDAIHQLQCTTGQCAEWVIDESITGSIVVRAVTSIVKKDDEYCWDVYVGDVVVDMPASEATIIVTYKNQVCKSQKTIHR